MNRSPSPSATPSRPLLESVWPGVMVADPDARMRAAVRMLLADHGLALVAVREWRPTVVVLEPYRWDDQGDPGDGLLGVLHTVADVRAVDGRLPVVVDTAMFPPGMAPRLQQFGAGPVVMGSPPEELLAAVCPAHALGRGWLPVGVVR